MTQNPPDTTDAKFRDPVTSEIEPVPVPRARLGLLAICVLLSGGVAAFPLHREEGALITRMISAVTEGNEPSALLVVIPIPLVVGVLSAVCLWRLLRLEYITLLPRGQGWIVATTTGLCSIWGILILVIIVAKEGLPPLEAWPIWLLLAGSLGALGLLLVSYRTPAQSVYCALAVGIHNLTWLIALSRQIHRVGYLNLPYALACAIPTAFLFPLAVATLLPYREQARRQRALRMELARGRGD